MDRRKKRAAKAVMSIFLDNLGGSIDNVDVANFDSDGSDLKALVVGIEPVQSGTGDPSPDNVRPITGHSSVNVIVSPTLNPLDGTITNIPLGQTVYGGTLDVLTGVLTVDRAMVDLGTLNWNKTTGTLGDQNVFSISLGAVGNGMKPRARYEENTMISSQLRSCDSTIWFVASMPDNSVMANETRMYVCANAYTDAATFKSAMSGVQLVYELATPQIIQLTGQQISTFLGTNNVWCDSGQIIHLEY